MARNDNPDYDIRLPDWNQADPWFSFNEAMRKGTLLGGKFPKRVASESKRVPVHQRASTCDSLLKVYPDAIEVGAPAGSSEMVIVLPFFTLVGAFATILFGSGSVVAIRDMFKSGGWDFASFFFVLINCGPTLIFLLVTILFFRMSFCTPRDLPVLFNRKTREVSFFPVVPLKFWKFWKPAGVGPARTRMWDDLRARSYKMTEFTGSAGRESYLLALLWGEPDDPQQCKEIVTIGYKGWWEDELLWRLYEHIRRYMEENGPPIQPGERLRTSGMGRLPKFPPEVVAAAGGPALSADDVHRMAGQAAV